MEITEGRAGNAVTLKIAGRVDSSVSKQLEQKAVEIMSRESAVVVDLSGMSYVSSAGLRSFIILAKNARANNKVIALAGMREEISEVFEISGLLSLFTIYETVDQAIATLPR